MKKYLVKVNGTSYEVEVNDITAGVQPVVQPAAQPAVSAAPAPAAIPAAAAPAADTAPDPAQGALKITAPMPGTVLRIDAVPGDVVKKGRNLVILEAMKMENEIVSPEDATVVSVNTTKGASVNAGDLLVTLQP